MTTAATLPSSQQAHEVVCDIHKRAYLGRLAQHGEVAQTEKEAFALLDLGIALDSAEVPSGAVKEASEGGAYGDGPYAGVLGQFLSQHGPSVAPGFEDIHQPAGHVFGKSAAEASELPQQLLDDAWGASLALAQSPEVYGAAIVKRADNERLLAEAVQQDAGGEKSAEATTETETPAE